MNKVFNLPVLIALGLIFGGCFVAYGLLVHGACITAAYIAAGLSMP